MAKIKCIDCGKVFDSPTKHRCRCPGCHKKRINERATKYSHSPKGQQKAHAYYLAHKEKYCFRPKEPCPKCGQPKLVISTLCRKCKDKEWRGERHHSWKGGRQKTKQDYMIIYKPEHLRTNRRGYVFEHILVWEQTYDKPLPKGWVIHHLNGIRDDNRPRNLVALPNRKHSFVLHAKAKRIQELEALLNHQNQLL